MDLFKDITRELRGGTRDDERTTNSRRDPDRGDSTTGEESDGDDEHLCSFCQTVFDASRRTCPECDAEIVFRGDR